MKKLIAVILSLALCCLLIPAVAEEASVAGTWYLVSANAQGQDIQVVNPEGITVTINEDGTFTISVSGLAKSGTWTSDGSVLTMSLTEGDTTEFKVDGEELVYELSGINVRMSRTPGEKPAGPAAVTAESVDAFDGTWIPQAQIMYGLYAEMSPETVAASGAVKIEAGKISSMYSNGEDGYVELASYDAALADGKLSFSDESMIPFTAVLTLLDDGRLLYETTMTAGGEGVTIGYIYVREAAAEEPAA